MEQQSLAELKTRIAPYQQFPADLSSSPDVGRLPGGVGEGGGKDFRIRRWMFSTNGMS